MATRPGRSVRVDSCASAAMPVPEQPHVAILAEGQLDRRTAKTAIGVIRYAPYPVVAIVDSTRAGTDAAAAIGATGQTGIAIAGTGISVDAVVADFIAGAAERMVCDAAESADWVVVEGQGSLTHPGFSGVTLGLLHGSAPDALLLCHDASRTEVKGFPGRAIRPLRELVPLYESAAVWTRAPGSRVPVVAVALNPSALDAESAARAIAAAAEETALPAADPVREGAAGSDRLVAALLR